ncbi:hypothetical protein N8T08_004398 [Aspergillus melleus]|uniref:Uncharacterized protein n=1 Tax=Aspergillus melleus TaxID=138277 RepID=A0ACC3B4H2_9EURO|nr:hypothetical protein N8T08_004398 [Aspergillus melleus]
MFIIIYSTQPYDPVGRGKLRGGSGFRRISCQPQEEKSRDKPATPSDLLLLHPTIWQLPHEQSAPEMEQYNDQESSGLADNPDNSSQAPEVGHACNPCRRRKLRCSRELPTCQHCRKSAYDCLYEAKRAKPGMKAGALDNLHRRLDGLERSIERHQAKLESLEAEEPYHDSDPNVNAILSSLATNLQSLSKRSTRRIVTRDDTGGPAKRRRINDDTDPNQAFTATNIPPLPEETIINATIESYFHYVHPWIPIIHEARFRRRLDDDDERDKLRLVIHAVSLAASRYAETQDDAVSQEDVRDWIVAQAMKQSSVEALQALVIIAYNDVGAPIDF